MIRSFESNGKRIALTAEAEDGRPLPNIFAADAMTLIVGQNGSGKTTLLGELATHIASGDSSYVRAEHRLDSYDVVAFNPSKVGAIQHPRSTRITSLIGDVATQIHFTDTALTDMLAKVFDVELVPQLRITAKARGPGVSGISLIRSALNELLFSGFSESQEIYELHRKLVEVSTALMEERAGASSTTHSIDLGPLEERARRLDVALNKELEAHVRARFRGETDLHLRALAATCKGTELTAHFAGDLLPHFGFPTDGRVTSNFPTWEFQRNLNILRDLASALRSPQLDKRVYALSPTVMDQIRRTPLEGIAAIEFKGLSTGMSALLGQVSLIHGAVSAVQDRGRSHLLLLIDEGDTHLHFEWQRRYVHFINEYVKHIRPRFNSIQVVLSTHSAILMSDFPRWNIRRLATMQRPDGKRSHGVDHSPVSTFGASLESIVRVTGGAGTIGSFASEFIRDLLGRVRDGRPIPAELVDLVDDPMLRHYLATRTALHREPADADRHF
ncbi:AAA family ATPase [Stenotrophomonas sp. GZD-301]|uniref:AAA family ATPase n=1 Tax=Stenotrophomonas sp. GZD-301 TaxID=3404814 RepID=UPI003BB779F4